MESKPCCEKAFIVAYHGSTRFDALKFFYLNYDTEFYQRLVGYVRTLNHGAEISKFYSFSTPISLARALLVDDAFCFNCQCLISDLEEHKMDFHFADHVAYQRAFYLEFNDLESALAYSEESSDDEEDDISEYPEGNEMDESPCIINDSMQ